MVSVDVRMLKSILERLSDLLKAGEPVQQLSSGTDSGAVPFSTKSKTDVGGPTRSHPKAKGNRTKGHSYGQKHTSTAGRRKPSVTSPPSEAPQSTYQWPVEDKGYVNDI